MSTQLFALLVLAGAAIYFMTPEERGRLTGLALGWLRGTVRNFLHPTESVDPFADLLRARTRWVIVTPLLVTLHVLGFMMSGAASAADPQAAIELGANFAPRTTNGEWLRLFTSTFVHGGFLHLLATVAGLLPLGLILERTVGRLAFAAVYISAGVLASLVSLWTISATSVTYGASGAVFGIYGLLIASAIWAIVQRPPVPIPLLTAQQVAATAAVFLLYNLFTDHLGGQAELAGFGAGLAGGLLIAKDATLEKPSLLRAAMLTGAAAVLAMAAAIPLRGINDFRPQIAYIVAVEQRTASAYDDAVGEFTLGRVPAKRLVQLIDRTILPELQGVRARVSALRGVPREQAPLVEAAEAYFKLREQSWRRRKEGLVGSSNKILREAERTEQAALEAFRKIQPLT